VVVVDQLVDIQMMDLNFDKEFLVVDRDFGNRFLLKRNNKESFVFFFDNIFNLEMRVL
jgi:hypothetical protein